MEFKKVQSVPLSKLLEVKKAEYITVQLIPTDINGTFGHLGGVSEIKAQNQEIESEKKHG